MLFYKRGRNVMKMALEDESAQECMEINEQSIREEYSDSEPLLERHQFIQESRTDFDREYSMEIQMESSNFDDNDEGISLVEPKFPDCPDSTVGEDPLEGTSGLGQNCCNSYVRSQVTYPVEGGVESSSQNGVESSFSENTARLERYGNYLERYGPQLERYGSQLERFGNQLERIGPQLERCGSNLERYGPQLEAIGRQLMPSPSRVESSPVDDRPRSQPHNNMSLQMTQTESGNEGYVPQSADSCQGSSAPSSNRHGQWINAPNSRRLSRRPSFQVNDGMVRHWIRRRSMESRDFMPFNRFREERRRFFWRNDGDLRDFRRLRSSWRYQDNIYNRPQLDNGRENIEIDDNAHARLGRSQLNQQQDNGAILEQDVGRMPRHPSVHHDDPDFGFVLVDDNTAGPSRPGTSNIARRPRSHMSLRPLNVFSPPILGPIAEYNPEPDEENQQRHDLFGRRAVRGRDGNVIRSWAMMNNYFQPRPLFIGQGDSKAVDVQFTLQRIAQHDNIYNGNERNLEVARIDRPMARNERADRRNERQHLALQALTRSEGAPPTLPANLFDI